MNEPNFPLDPVLSRFERDLKSLSPKSLLSLPAFGPPPTPPELPPSSEFSAVIEPSVVPAPNVVLAPSGWLRTVAIAWSSGLAAGLLISAMWTRESSSDVSASPSDLIATNQIHPLPDSSDTQKSGAGFAPGTTANRPQAARSGFGANPIRSSSRYVAFDSFQTGTLHPLSPLHRIGWDWKGANTSFPLNPSDNDPSNEKEQEDAPNTATHNGADGEPSQNPLPPGQRQLLKRLLESDSSVSA